MSVALGVRVCEDAISAVLVETHLPGLGPVASRPVSIAATPGGVGDAVITVIGIMRVQAAQRKLVVDGAAVVCADLAHCDAVRAALAARHLDDVEVLAVGDPRLDDRYPLDVAAAVVGAAGRVDGLVEEPGAVGTGVRDADTASGRASRYSTPVMVGLALAALAAVSGATVWALTVAAPMQSSVRDTAEVSQPFDRSEVRERRFPIPPETNSVEFMVPVTEPGAASIGETGLGSSGTTGPSSETGSASEDPTDSSSDRSSAGGRVLGGGSDDSTSTDDGRSGRAWDVDSGGRPAGGTSTPPATSPPATTTPDPTTTDPAPTDPVPPRDEPRNPPEDPPASGPDDVRPEVSFSERSDNSDE